MKRFLFAILSLTLLTASKCEPDSQGPCEEERQTAAIVSDVPDSIKVGNDHLVDVDFVLDNSCGEFERFDVTSTEKSFNIKLITKYSGCNCNLEFEEAATQYLIDIKYPGIYELNFWQADGEWDTHNVTIYE